MLVVRCPELLVLMVQMIGSTIWDVRGTKKTKDKIFVKDMVKNINIKGGSE